MESSKTKSKKILANNIIRYLEIQHMDRKALASKLGVKYSTLCDWVQPNHASYPKADMIQKIADAIGVGMYYLLSENEGDDLVFMVDKMLESKVIIPVLGKVPAGVPYEAIENSIPETYETIPKTWLKGDKKYFALILDGDSMEPKYHDGDTAIFLKTPTCESGDLCCIRIGNNEATFKKVTLLDDGILVSPLNKNNSSGFSETFYSAEKLEMEPIEIIGTLVECRPSNIIK